MRKDRLYFYTFLAVTLIFTIIASIAIQYSVRVSAVKFIDIQLESSKREAKEFASLIDYQLERGISKDSIRDNIQTTIDNSNVETGFISIVDWSENQVSHPDKTRNGLKVNSNESLVTSINDDITSETFYKFLKTQNSSFDETNIYQAIYQLPISNADWVVIANINIERFLNQINSIKTQFYIIFIIMGFVIVLASVISVRLIGSFYEKRLEAENKKLEDEVFNLVKLNDAIDKLQQKANEEKIEQRAKEELEEKETSKDDKKSKKSSEQGKKRILTYLRHEILSVATEDIAYIYTENTITYVVDIKGKRSTVNSSLDEMQSNLDGNLFYRANRQFIISIIAIEKIIRYGNNQLKILMTPESENDIIIGKNKAAEFKQWLNL